MRYHASAIRLQTQLTPAPLNFHTVDADIPACRSYRDRADRAIPIQAFIQIESTVAVVQTKQSGRISNRLIASPSTVFSAQPGFASSFRRYRGKLSQRRINSSICFNRRVRRQNPVRWHGSRCEPMVFIATRASVKPHEYCQTTAAARHRRCVLLRWQRRRDPAPHSLPLIFSSCPWAIQRM